MSHARRLWWLSLVAVGLPLAVVARGDDKASESREKDKDKAKAAAPAEPPKEVLEGITAREVKTHMTFLASDFMRGRNTASTEIRIAGEYLAAHLAGLGALPGGDPDFGRRSYFQRFPLESPSIDAEKTSLSLVIDLTGTKQVTPLQFGNDYSIMPFNVTTTEIEAPVVFAGYGVVDAASKHDDYKDLDVKNKIVVVLPGSPPGPRAMTKGAAGRRGFGNPKAEEALKRGALALVTINNLTSPTVPTVGNVTPFRGGAFMSLARGTVGIPTISLRDSARDLLARAGGLTAENMSKPRPLEGVKMKLNLAVDRKAQDDRNVIGYFPGSDPKLRNEVIIYSAHYDHVGVNEAGEIFNGSDDNASGTTAILEIAEAIATGPRPKRSVAFLWVSGEEKGLLGSEWFADHVSLPSEMKIVADINLDMVSRNDGKSVGITPSKSHPDYSTLITDGLDACKAEGLTAKFDADQFYARTDSYNFAKKGIPIIFFFSGVHEDYHKPTDDVAKADFDKAARIARAAYRIGFKAANAPEAPKKIDAKKENDKEKEKEKNKPKDKVAESR